MRLPQPGLRINFYRFCRPNKSKRIQASSKKIKKQDALKNKKPFAKNKITRAFVIAITPLLLLLWIC